MPIIQNNSDKYKPKLILLSALYVIVPLAAVIFFYNLFTAPKDSEETQNEKEIRYICIEKDVEQYIVDKVETWALDHTEYKTTEETETVECKASIERNSADPNDLQKLFDTTYVLVRRQGSSLTNISEQQFLNALITQNLGDYTLIWNDEVDSFLRSNFNIGVGQVVYTDAQIADRLVSDQLYIAIVKESLDLDSLRVIKIENNAPSTSNYNSSRYPLVDRYWIGGSDEDDIETVYGILVEETGTDE